MTEDSEAKTHDSMARYALLISGGVTLKEAKENGYVLTPSDVDAWHEAEEHPEDFSRDSDIVGAWVPSWIDEWTAKYLPIYHALKGGS